MGQAPVGVSQAPEDSTNTSTSRDTSTVSLSDEEYEAIGEKEDPLSVMKMEVEEHQQLQNIYGQAKVVHVPNPYYMGSNSSEEETEQEVTLARGGPEEEQGQEVTMQNHFDYERLHNMHRTVSL